MLWFIGARRWRVRSLQRKSRRFWVIFRQSEDSAEGDVEEDEDDGKEKRLKIGFQVVGEESEEESEKNEPEQGILGIFRAEIICF